MSPTMQAMYFASEIGCGLFMCLGLFWFFTGNAENATFRKIRSAVGWTAIAGLLIGIISGVAYDSIRATKEESQKESSR